MFEWIGFLGGFLFATGCVPVAWLAWYSGRSVGVPIFTQWLLFISCALYSVYLLGAFGFHWPFVFLVIEVASWGIALWYHYFPRRA